MDSPGVMWRGPADDAFTFYTAAQWRALARVAMAPHAAADVEANLALAARHGGRVFCRATQGGAVPLLGPLFGATVTTWVVRAPPRRSPRLGIK